MICSVGPDVCWKCHPQFVGDDGGQRGFAQPGRPVEQHVVERLAAGFGGFDGYGQVFFDLGLPNKFAQTLRPELQFKRRVVFNRSG